MTGEYILLALHNRNDRAMISSFLRERNYTVREYPEVRDPTDLLIVDGPMLESLQKQIFDWKEDQAPLFFPVLFVTTHPSADVLTRHLWKTVDELIRVPLLPVELHARIEMLLRARRLSLQLRDYARALTRELEVKRFLAAAALGGGFLRIDPLTRRVHILAPEETSALPFETWLEGVHPSFRESLIRELGQEYPAGRPTSILYRSNDLRWYLLQLLPVEDQNGTPSLYGLAVDITRLKQSEAELQERLQERNTLLKEVHHRTKNTLQLIVSLLSLKGADAHCEADRKLLSDIETRVRALALLYNRLYQEELLARVDLSHYLRDVVDTIVQIGHTTPHLIQRHLKLSPLQLPPGKAVPLALILTECLLNSLTHAFGKTEKGHIRVELLEESGRGYFRYEDSGPGVPEGTPRRFGFTIMESLVRSQLKGTIEFSSSPDWGGWKVSIEFPL
ncbi:signal transduction histidine kinase [Spirochaeta thermophila DSM 6578]|uniref:histidine kinase n=1 Tax=Winmispira thermophila (strain ATCC 700085 / DSM 6578 / Z-1203) TaxID=869211 RepID=G0GDB2_WINT7|nr:sensor histidine kinase [Spirochaeta thermophila]AEJ60538.1 signal transduction histidine kinase [Spirochaeta thermophila DSM 6578]